MKSIFEKDFSRRSFLAALGIDGVAFAGALTGCSSNDTSTQDETGGTGQDSGSGDTPAGAPATTEDGASGNVLVAYYSAQGHTARAAQAAADALGADLFEIVPAQPYSDDDLNWNNPDSRVSREHDDEGLRDVALDATTPENFADYDTVLIGYPIWWAIAAWPVDRFVSDNDFSGKTVIPFCTSASSGLGRSVELLAELSDNGDWQDGQRFSSSVSDDEVRAWAEGL